MSALFRLLTASLLVGLLAACDPAPPAGRSAPGPSPAPSPEGSAEAAELAQAEAEEPAAPSSDRSFSAPGSSDAGSSDAEPGAATSSAGRDRGGLQPLPLLPVGAAFQGYSSDCEIDDDPYAICL